MELVKTWQHSMGFSKLPQEVSLPRKQHQSTKRGILESICKVWKIKPSKLSINSACGDSTLKVFLVVSAIFFFDHPPTLSFPAARFCQQAGLRSAFVVGSLLPLRV